MVLFKFIFYFLFLKNKKYSNSYKPKNNLKEVDLLAFLMVQSSFLESTQFTKTKYRTDVNSSLSKKKLLNQDY